MNYLTLLAAQAAGKGSSWTMILMMVAVFAVMYFLMIRPQKKKQKEEQAMRDNLQIGDEITTIGGIVGKIVTVKDDSLIIETGADRNRMKITRWAISQNNTANEKLAAERAAAKEAAEKEKAARMEAKGKTPKKKNKEEKEIDGVKTTITTGKVEITDNENSVYKYQLIKVTDSNKDFETLIENMNKATNMFEKLKAYKHFYNRYYELVPSPRDLAWQEVKNMTIPQPETSENGDKYILWLMQDGDIIDLQVLTCTRAEDGGEEIETVIVKETSKLPFTYDSMILFIVLGVLIVLAIVLLIVKNRKNEK